MSRIRFARRIAIGFVLLGVVIGGYRIVLWYAASREPLSAIVVPGGGIQRELAAAQLSRGLSNLPIVVSSGSLLPCLYHIFVVENELPWSRIVVDFRATDTFSNFTSLVPLLTSHHYRNVLVVTSERQLTRTRALAGIIFGTAGIAFEVLTIPGGSSNETAGKTLLDAIRALGWVALGDSVAGHFYQPEALARAQLAEREAPCERGGLVRIPDHVSLP